MGKGLGLAGLIILLLSFPIPIFGTFIGFLALAIVSIAALFGSKTLVVATTVLAAVKMYALSPAWMATMYANTGGGISFNFILTTFFTALPIAALLFRPMIIGLLQQVGLFKSD